MSGFGVSPFSKIGFICLFTADFEESIKFYRDILGLEQDSQVSTDNFFAFKTGSTQLALEKNGFRKESQKTKEENPVLLQFRAVTPEQLEQMTQQLELHSVRIINRAVEHSWGMGTSFLDPDGNKLEIVWMK